jgi:hypothetical protein
MVDPLTPIMARASPERMSLPRGRPVVVRSPGSKVFILATPAIRISLLIRVLDSRK